MRILPIVLAALLLPASAFAQGTTLRGSVADPNGSPLRTSEITLEPTHQSATPDADGHFAVPNIAPGLYTLTVKAPGFATASVPVTVTTTTPLDIPAIVLRVATVTSGVDVTAPLSQTEIANAQIHDEEHQRLLGVLPNFFVTYDPKPAPLTAHQKFALSFRTLVDPSSYVITGIVAGVEQATETYPGYGYGFSGYATRYAAAFGGEVVGIMVSGAIVPSLLHQDPRYFYKGTGSVKSRVGYALATPSASRATTASGSPTTPTSPEPSLLRPSPTPGCHPKTASAARAWSTTPLSPPRPRPSEPCCRSSSSTKPLPAKRENVPNPARTRTPTHHIDVRFHTNALR